MSKHGGDGKNTSTRHKIMKYLTSYCSSTSFHGFHFISEKNVQNSERWFWLAVCALSFSINAYMLSLVYIRFKDSPTITTIETNYFPVWDNPFPAVTICNTNVVYAEAINRFIKTLNKKYDTTYLENIFRKLPVLIKPNYGKVSEKEVEELGVLLKLLGMDAEEFMKQVSQPCEKLLVQCYFQNTKYECLEMFTPVKTPEGFCCSFNWHIKSTTSYKTRKLHENFEEMLQVRATGDKQSGLTVIVDTERMQYYATLESYYGAKVLLHDPEEYPETSIRTALLLADSELTIEIDGSITESSPNVRLLAVEQRKCVFEDEVKLESSNDYNLQSCITECRSKMYKDVCGCVPFFYPKIKQFEACGVDDVPCMNETRGYINSVSQFEQENMDKKAGNKTFEPCVCRPPCSDTMFTLNKYTTGIAEELASGSEFEFTHDANLSILNVYFRESFCIKYRTESVMTWDALLVSFGGIFSLCLGGSVISFIELVYWFTIRLLTFSRSKESDKPKPTSLPHTNNTVIIQPLFTLQTSNTKALQLNDKVDNFMVHPYQRKISSLQNYGFIP